MRLIIILVVIFSVRFSFAQKKKNSIFKQDSIPLKNILKKIEYDYHVKFSYISELIQNKKVYVNYSKNNSLSELLLDISLQTKLDFNPINPTYIYIVKSTSHQSNSTHM